MKWIALSNNMLLFLVSTQSNINSEASFVGIHHVLIKIWVSEHEFQNFFGIYQL